jgi:hypothetical protein
LPQPIDEIPAICAQLSRYHSQLVAALYFSAAPLTAEVRLSMAWQRIKETPAYVSSEPEQR